MTYCKQCGEEMEDAALTCPKCGAKKNKQNSKEEGALYEGKAAQRAKAAEEQQKETKKKNLLLAVGFAAGVVVIVCAILLGISRSPEQTTAQPKESPTVTEEQSAPEENPEISAEIQGECGDGVFWKLDPETGTLTISGAGSMTEAPWQEYKDLIKEVIVEDGVQSIVTMAFSGCENLQTVILPNTLTTIEDYAFEGCTALIQATYTGTEEQWAAVTVGSGNDRLTSVVYCKLFADESELPTDIPAPSLEEEMERFMADYQLTEDNFSMSYYNTVTGESYDFNELKFVLAANTYKLPLNMYFYELEAQGKIDANATFRHTGMSLADVRRESILHSNNEVSEAMIGYFPNYYEYKECMRKYSTIPIEDVSDTFYMTNHSCTRMMIDTLKYLYDHSDEFEEMIDNMKHAMPGEYFQAGVSEYEVAHKYGQVDHVVNDVAIIYTPQPFLLAVYTQGTYGTGICAQMARLMTNYTVWREDYVPKADMAEDAVLLVTGVADQVVSGLANAPSESIPEETEPVEVPEQTVEEDQGSEEVLPEEQETEEKTTQEQPEETIEEMTEETQWEDRQQDEDDENKSVWIIIGAASLLLLVAIPLIMKRRYR